MREATPSNFYRNTARSAIAIGSAMLVSNKGTTNTMSSQTKNNMATVENENTTLGRSYIKFATRNKPIKGVVPGCLAYQDQYLVKIQWGGNRKQYSEICAVGTKEQWLTTGALTNRVRQTYTPWFGLNPEEGRPAGSITNALTGIATDRLALTVGTIYFDIMNSTSLSCFGKLHVFQCKTDNNGGPMDDMADAINTYQKTYNTDYGWPAGAGQVPTGAGNNTVVYQAHSGTTLDALITVPYTTLAQGRLLKNNWIKLKTHSIALAGGDNHRLTVQCALNMFGLKDRLGELDASVIYPKGSVAFIWESQGSMCQDTTATTGTFGLSGGEINMSITRKLSFAPLRSTVKRFKAQWVSTNNISSGANPPANKQLVQGTFSSVAGVTI